MNKKLLGFKDVVIMTMAATIGIRWIAVAAGIGSSAILFWFLGALLFYLPLSLIVAELSSKYPEEGGMYMWTRHGLGDGPAFIVAWLYWLTNLFYYPAILTFFATTFVYAINKPELANNKLFVILTVIISFWLITLLILKGVKVSKYLAEICTVLGTFIPFLLLLIGAFIIFFLFHDSATHFSLSGLLPNQNLSHNLSSLSMLMFAMAGIEVIPTLANSIENPRKMLPKALLIATIVIFLSYVVATISMNVLMSPESIQKTTGLMHTFVVMGQKFHITWISQMMGALIVFSEMGALSIWLLVPAVMFFKTTQPGIIPGWLHRENKWEVPQNALLMQAVVVTVIVLLTTLLPTVNAIYQLLVLMSTIVYFLPYCFLVVSYIKLRRQPNQPAGFSISSGNKIAFIAAGFVIFSLILAIILSFQLDPDLVTFAQKFLYEAELAGGPILLVLIGMILYRKRQKISTE